MSEFFQDAVPDEPTTPSVERGEQQILREIWVNEKVEERLSEEYADDFFNLDLCDQLSRRQAHIDSLHRELGHIAGLDDLLVEEPKYRGDRWKKPSA